MIFRFERIYKTAMIVEECVEDYYSFEELDWDASEIINTLTRPHKLSILHQYIYTMTSIEERRDFRKNSDFMLDEYDDNPDGWIVEKIFNVYDIKYVPLKRYSEKLDIESDDLYNWFLFHEPSFERLWEKLTDEVFHILFANRTFLLKFNTSLAQFLQIRSNIIPPKYISKRGKIRRTNIPAWLKRAVFYRDKGKCVMCQKDLTGLVNNQNKLHFDHIVPLSKLGTNDSSNFQLLCDSCNLVKSDKDGQTSYLYEPWWNY